MNQHATHFPTAPDFAFQDPSTCRPCQELTNASPKSRLTTLYRGAVLASLRTLKVGRLVLVEGDQQRVFGDPNSADAAEVHVLQPQFFRSLVRGGSLGAGEAYQRGEWSSPDLVAVIRLLARNRNALQSFGGWTKQLWIGMQRLFHRLRHNSRSGSRRNIAAHYDLSNEFFATFLDETMTYSCGIFSSETSSLRDASIEKYDRICRRLQLRDNDHVVEIGTGWGGFAMHAAQHYGCRITTTTISQEQFQLAQKRIVAAGLNSRITLLLRDYRDLSGEFDKLVSIEMIEAVGQAFLPRYFETCSRLLRPNGAMLLQAITIPDQRYQQYLRSVDFIQRHIFPGGSLPSLGAIQSAVGQCTDLRITELVDFGQHYAQTLRRWRESFHARSPTLRGMGYSEMFLRTWDYYFCYCEGAFLENQVGVAQILLEKPQSHFSRTI